MRDELAGKTIGLVEQRALAGTRGKKGGLTTYGRKGRRLKRSTEVSLSHIERKLERQKPS